VAQELLLTPLQLQLVQHMMLLIALLRLEVMLHPPQLQMAGQSAEKSLLAHTVALPLSPMAPLQD
jgi:hypothetical protein